ncbi:flagellar hook-associated protein FlgK [Candidatus Liberibacter americanus]|uniref:Flagellar hook-associated protein 1 n=1 Tax=Candidatus Liberibacter americanus str. Sao Paulo TaxID=1261131 RepID=U6B586_9HYPH|nr:flagellar hook-associated protein FlgK [Candidatus Liberibacter americanus]AHA27758.1 Flagellar hook-associated protein FlgK [Candidatus Liberibacter americanus str. Sao Paulo]EMS36143.1 flagellar hook-associated protein FlgK [Candidatus Liberibacter americanus PW_SP]
MSLSTAFNMAHNIFINAGEQLSVLVKNIENSGNKNYSRREVGTASISHGMTVVTRQRVQDQHMFQKILDTSSSFLGQKRLLEGFESLKEIMGYENDYDNSPSHYVSKLKNSLQQYSNDSSNDALGTQVIENALGVANNLNRFASDIQKIRANLDKEIDLEIYNLRGYLSELTFVNNAIKSSPSSKDTTNELFDKRDLLLQKISEIISISTVKRNNDDIVIYSSGSVALFETVPRDITFQRTETYSANIEGKSVFIDGVVVPYNINSIPKGKIEALLQIRDGFSPILQNQLDEMARGLISIFSEKDISGSLKDVPGLFVSAGSISSSDKLQKGLSDLIRVNPKYQDNPHFLRDGGSISKDYKWNHKGFSGYSDLIAHYNSSLNKNFSFDPISQIGANTSLIEYARNSIGWLEERRSNSHDVYMRSEVSFNHISNSYSNLTGVNLQEELNFLMQVEQSYNISNKLMNSINEMMRALLEGVK